MPKAQHEIKNTQDLRAMLIDTISQVKSGKIDHKQARTIAALSATILNSAKLDLDFLRFNVANETVDTSKNRVLSLINSDNNLQ